MTDSPPPVQFAQVTIADREITVRRPTEIQLVMIRRSMKVGEAQVAILSQLEDAKGTDETELDAARTRGLDAVSDMLDMIERLVVSMDDRAFLVDRMREGVIDLPDLEAITMAFADRKQEGKKVAKAKLVK